MKELLTTADTAKVLGVCKGTLKVWRRIGKGPKVVRLGRTVRYSTVHVEAFIKDHRESMMNPEKVCGIAPLQESATGARSSKAVIVGGRGPTPTNDGAIEN